MKLYYTTSSSSSSLLPDALRSHKVWTSLLQQENEPHTKDVIGALLIGTSRGVWLIKRCGTCLLLIVGVPPSRREEVWQHLSQLYQSRNRIDWNYPTVLCGEESFHRLGEKTTEYEHNISVDIGTRMLTPYTIYM